MAEIRANREYKFKEFCISEEIPKSPPKKTKRWTFQDTNQNNNFNIRPVQRKWDEKEGSWSIDPNTIQFVKPFTNESDLTGQSLRAEFYNAYKKYYRRVDIKRLEVESTLNVDAKFKRTDESIEGESSLYKEKECMEINIVMDTEKDDALVSSKVRRTVLCVSPSEDSFGKENVPGVPEEMAKTGQNTIMEENLKEESGYCSSPENCLIGDLPLIWEHDPVLENQPSTSKLKQEFQSSIYNNIPLIGMSENINNNESKSIFDHGQHDYFSCNKTVQNTNSLVSDQRSSESFPMIEKTSTESHAGLIKKAETNKRTFYNSKLKQNGKDPVNPTPFKFRNFDEKSRYGIFDNDKTNFKRSIGSSYTNDESMENPFVEKKNNFDSSTPKTNSFNFDSEMLTYGKDYGTDSKYKNVQNYELKFDDGILSDRKTQRKFHSSESVGYNFEPGTSRSFQVQDKNKNNNALIPCHKSAQETPRTNSTEKNKNVFPLRTEKDDPNSKAGIRFRGLRGATFNESKRNDLTSLVVNVLQCDSSREEIVIKRELKRLPQKEPDMINHVNSKKGVSNMEKNGFNTGFQKQFVIETKSDTLAPSELNYHDSSYEKLEVPETLKNYTKSSTRSYDSKDQKAGSSYTSARRENMEEPFVIWTNKDGNKLTESETNELQMNKLTISDNDLDKASVYVSNSNPQVFYDWCSFNDMSNTRVKRDKQDRNHSQNSQKGQENIHSIEVSKTTNKTEGKDHEDIGETMPFPAKRYSNVTSVRSEHCAIPKYRSHNESSIVFERKCNKEDEDHGRVPATLAEKGGWIDERRRNVNQRYSSEELFDQRGSIQESRKYHDDVRGLGENTRLVPGINNKHRQQTVEEKKSIGRRPEEDYGKKETSNPLEHHVLEHLNIKDHESNECDKKKSSEFLQMGPTYSVHYNPADDNILKKDSQRHYDETLEREKMEDHCHRREAFHCSLENSAEFIRKERNESSFNHSSYYDNYLYRKGMNRNAYHKYKNDIDSCVHHYNMNTHCCECEDHNWRFNQRMMKMNDIRACRDNSLYCHNSNCYNWPMRNKHRCRCQGEDRNCCQQCGDELMRFLFKKCSENIQNTCCSRCSNDIRVDKVCTSKGKCCGTTCGDEKKNSCSETKEFGEQKNSCLLRLDGERQWMSTGHQPTKTTNKGIVAANIDQSKESSNICDALNNVPSVREFENHHPINAIYSNHLNDNKYQSTENQRKNPYIYDREMKNVCHVEATENEHVPDSPRSIKPEVKFNRNSINSKRVSYNIPSSSDDSSSEDEFKITTSKEKHCVQKTRLFSREDKMFCIEDSVNRSVQKTENEVPESDETNEPPFLREEQWDSDDELPMRRHIRKTEDRKESIEDSSDSEKEPIYLKEETWDSDYEETGGSNGFSRYSRRTPVRYKNGFSGRGKGRRSTDRQAAGRSENFSDGEESRKCSSVHAVSDPSFHCEQQWGSDEEKCDDHKSHSTLPKNRTNVKKGGRGGKGRSFNPRRWDMVTDLPKNEYDRRYSNHEGGNFGNSMVFQNRKYLSNNGH